MNESMALQITASPNILSAQMTVCYSDPQRRSYFSGVASGSPFGSFWRRDLVHRSSRLELPKLGQNTIVIDGRKGGKYADGRFVRFPASWSRGAMAFTSPCAYIRIGACTAIVTKRCAACH
jgi:hypothetical protein